MKGVAYSNIAMADQENFPFKFPLNIFFPHKPVETFIIEKIWPSLSRESLNCRGNIGGASGEKGSDQENTLALLWTLCLTLLSHVKRDSFLCFLVHLNLLFPIGFSVVRLSSASLWYCLSDKVVTRLALNFLEAFSLGTDSPSRLANAQTSRPRRTWARPYNIDEPDAVIWNKDGHITGDLGHFRPLECRRGIGGGLGMQTRTQLGDEQWGQMRSYLTHIWHSTCPGRWLMNNWGNRSSAGRRKDSAAVYAWAQAANSNSACGLASSWCFTKLLWVYKSLE